MIRIIFLLLLFFSSQLITAQKPAFLRVYNSHGKKINKGELFQTSDTSITLTRRNLFTETPITQINVIKSNRTTGHRVAITTLSILSVVGVAILLANSLNDTNRPNGYINRGNNKSRQTNTVNPMLKKGRPLKKYKVNQDQEEWKKQRVVLNLLL